MQEQGSISLHVKLKYWELYRLNVVLMATVFHKVLYIWGFVTMLWLALSLLLLFRPSHGQDWAVMTQNASPLKWLFGLPVLFLFILPLLSARKLLGDEALKRGVSYQFSDSGFHVETTVSKTDFTWAAIHGISEARSSFLVFTKPNIAFMLPKRCFESTEGVAALRELFRVHVPGTKLRRG
jgi:YcxB-like protein